VTSPATNGNTGLVLLGFAEALSAPEVAWSLVDAGFRVLAFGRQGRLAALRQSRYLRVIDVTPPEVSHAAALADISRILRDHSNAPSARVLYPLDDSAVWLCAQLPASTGWTLAGPSGADLQLALDKHFQARTAKECGLRVPETSVATTREEAISGAKSFPVILKPAAAAIPAGDHLLKGSNWICASSSEVSSAVDQWQARYPLVMQPFIPGNGEGVFGFATASGVISWSSHRRLRMMNPHGSGSSACVSQAVPEEVKQPIERMVSAVGWRGAFMVELLRDNRGQLWFMEFNGRPWGSIALSRRQGFEYPAWSVRLALQREVSASTHRVTPGLVCRHAGREFMHLLFVLRGRKSSALTQWPSFWRSACGVLGVRPRDSLYNFRRDDLKVFVSDFVCTVRGQVSKPSKKERTNV
jgi:predicted ATP-grasp superfamily ATP-dependent carboligase